MSDEDLFERVQLLLQRELTPAECQFLMLANEVLGTEKRPLQKAAAAAAAKTMIA